MSRRGMQAVDTEAVEAETGLAVFEPQCKICQLTRECPDAAEVLYRMRFEENQSYRKLADYLNMAIADRGLDYRTVYASNLTGHFTNHVHMERTLVHELNKRAFPRVVHREAGDTQVLSRVLATKRDNYEKLQGNFEKWQKIFAVLFDKTGVSAGNAAGLTSDDVRTLKEATLGIGVIVGSMDKFIRDRDFVMEVMSFAIDLYATQTAHRLGEGLAGIKKVLTERDLTDPKTLAWYDGEIRQMLLRVVDGLYEECKTATVHNFGL